MVAGFAEDIDSEDESATPVITNHINEEQNATEHLRKPQKQTAAVTVELTSSEEEEEEEEEEDKSDDEEEKRIEREKKEKEEEKANAKQKAKSESVKLKLDMPVKSLITDEPAVDGFGLATDVVDDWLNSPDTDPKVLLLNTI